MSRKHSDSEALIFRTLLIMIATLVWLDRQEQFQPLVETTAHRLMIGEQVALAKWDSGKAVEDAPREAQVILDAVKDGVARGLDARYCCDRTPPLTRKVESTKHLQANHQIGQIGCRSEQPEA